MKKWYLITVILMIFFASCGVETPEAQITLSAPLHLVATNIFTNGLSQFLLQFDALNNETYFDGYNIYIADNQNDLLNNKGGLVLNTLGDKTKPTIPNLSPQTQSTTFIFLVSTFTNNQLFIASNTYYFDVKAFSSRYNKESLPSNITNAQWLPLTNNTALTNSTN